MGKIRVYKQNAWLVDDATGLDPMPFSTWREAYDFAYYLSKED